MAATKKKKKKTKAERKKELSKIKRLLKKPEFRAQAIELLKTLDDPMHWAAVAESIDISVGERTGIARVDDTTMTLLAELPDALDAVQARKKLIVSLNLDGKSTLDARAVPHLRKLVVRGFSRPWPSVVVLEQLEALEELELHNVPIDASLMLPPRLRTLAISGATSLPVMEGVEELQLRQVTAALRETPKLRHLRIASSPKLTDWTGMGSSDALERVEVIGASDVTNLDALAGAVGRGSPLRILSFTKCEQLQSIEGIRGATHLEEIRVFAAPFQSVEALTTCTSLRRVELRGCALRDVSCLRELAKLEVLDLTDCEHVSGIDALSDHPTLRVLAVGGTATTREQVGSLRRWSTWAANPHIPSLAARKR